MIEKYDIAIIGCGTAGYETALAASKAGLSTIIFEEKYIGGTCLNVGCIPTKAYLYKAKQYQLLNKLKVESSRDDLFSMPSISSSTQRVIARSQRAMETKLIKNEVMLIKETVSTFNSDTITTTEGNNYCFDKLILASGSSPFIPGLFQKKTDNPKLYTNENIFSLEEFPESITIVGGGVIGIEFAFFFSSFGVQVDIIELAQTILPFVDTDLVQEAKKLLKRKKVKIHENIKIAKLGDDLSISTADGAIISNERLLVATGRKANLPDHTINITLNQKGFVETSNCYQTNINNIFAIGDINGKSLLAHSASNQAFQLLEYITHGSIPTEKTIPSVIYLNPSLSSVGLNEKDLGDDFSCTLTKIPYGLSGKAQAEENTEGWIKLITNEDQLLGAHIYGPNGEDLLPLCTLAIDMKLSINELANTIYAHPSYCELLKEAFHAALQ